MTIYIYIHMHYKPAKQNAGVSLTGHLRRQQFVNVCEVAGCMLLKNSMKQPKNQQ